MLTSLSNSNCDQTVTVLLVIAMTEVSATVKRFCEGKKFSPMSQLPWVPGLLSCERMSIQEWVSMSREALSVALLLLLLLLHLSWAKTLHLSRVKTSLLSVNKG